MDNKEIDRRIAVMQDIAAIQKQQLEDSLKYIEKLKKMKEEK